MNKIVLTIFISSIVWIGCNNENSNAEKLRTTVDIKPEADLEPPVIYKGALYLGDEAQYLVACGYSKETWWINYDTLGDEFKNAYEDITKKPKEIYAEVKGYLGPAPEAKDEFSSGYDKVLNVTEIVSFNDLDDGNDCTRDDKVN